MPAYEATSSDADELFFAWVDYHHYHHTQPSEIHTLSFHCLVQYFLFFHLIYAVNLPPIFKENIRTIPEQGVFVQAFCTAFSIKTLREQA